MTQVIASYPVAYLIASLQKDRKARWLFWVLLAFWTSFLVRAFAWIVIGWFMTRTYHLYQLPLFSRKMRAVTDWTVGLFFRRDIAELGMLGHPRPLRDD